RLVTVSGRRYTAPTSFMTKPAAAPPSGERRWSLAPSPVVARWELSRRLATRRKELGIDVKSVTDALGFTRNYWSAVENDRTLIAEDKLRLLFDLFDFSDQDQSELLTLREDSRKRGWWDEYPALDAAYKRAYGMEAAATKLRAYGGHLVPGLLQVDAYARAIISANPGFRPVDLETVVAARRRRQKLLEVDPPDLQALLSEAVLYQHVAGPMVQREQLLSLRNFAANFARSRSSVRVLPFTVDACAIVNSTTLLFLDFASPHLPTTVWQEGVELFDDVDVEGDQGFRSLEIAWSEAIDLAASPIESLDLIDRALAILP
ncbi:MAG: Scr1 family TA system antitoxin-like transcriptional regulator, partial [Actinomycetota bacterium]